MYATGELTIGKYLLMKKITIDLFMIFLNLMTRTA